MSTVAHPYVEQRADGVLVLAGTQFKLSQIVLDRLAYNWDADEIQRQYPQLTLAQVHGALAYYYEHEAEVNEEVEKSLQKADEILASLPPAKFTRAQLLARKRHR